MIVNGDIIDVATAREALAQSKADAIMIGRGAYGRPWIAAALDRTLRLGCALVEPDLKQRLDIVLAHLAESLRFYGDALGLKVFRKHLGWYIEHAPLPLGCEAKRAGKSQLCRLESADAVEAGLIALWSGQPATIGAR